MILHTHSVMAFILALTAAGMFLHLYRLKQHVNAKRWLMAFYLGLFFWQLENVVRYSMPEAYQGTLLYKLSLTVVLIPSLSLTLVAHTQYVYRFLMAPFSREQTWVLRASIALFVVEEAFVVWNQFSSNEPNEGWRLSAFAFSSVFTLWMISVAIRKAIVIRPTDQRAAKAHYIYAAINGCYVIGSTISATFGFLTVIGSWSYFMFVWLGNLTSIVLYIVTAAVPASFQTKITGFSYVVAASILCVVTLSFYPPDYSADLAAQLAQHQGLKRLIIITFFVIVLIMLLMPFILQVSLTRPLQRLLEGVQRVNEGKLNTRVEVGLMDEIGLLTQNFNQMTQNLEKARAELTDYAHTLEKKVSMRTAQLQKSLNELKATQAQLIQTEKMASLGELTAGIAHEIKNPLNFIVNFSEISEDLAKELKEEIGKENIDKENVAFLVDDIAANFQKISFHGRRASSIVSSMLEHSRASRGVHEETDINELVESYLRTGYEEVQIKNKQFRAVLHKDLDPAAGRLNIIPEDIGRVLLNLFSNAFYAVNQKKAQQNGVFEPIVSVATRRLPNAVELRVKDNGTGIPETALDKIYQPFFTTKPAGEGTGLGLSLCYDIVTKGHGGEMQVHTEEGVGSEFVIRLPIRPLKNDTVYES